jgi:hypothetical protein
VIGVLEDFHIRLVLHVWLVLLATGTFSANAPGYPFVVSAGFTFTFSKKTRKLRLDLLCSVL